jgi:uncharacterized protein (DUF1800 family)
MKNISRRDLLQQVFSATSPSRSGAVNGSIQPYNQPLDKLRVKHLLRRATFGISNEMLSLLIGKSANEAVDILFNNADNKISAPPPYFRFEQLRNPGNLSGQQKEEESKKLGKHLGDYNYELGEWWVKLMKTDHNSVLEKMVLFWHGHFATQFAICDNIPAVSMYLQNQMFRANYAGNFKTLLENITLDGAMLRYLNGNENVSESPNENYARELLELFSIGVGNYTEKDIKEASKILTGWKVSPFIDEGKPYEARLNPNDFDKNSKLFMGEVFNVNYSINEKNVFENSIKRLIDVILTKKRQEAATFITQKIYRYFVYSNPDSTDQKTISDLAKILLDNDFDFKPMLKTLFKSQHFFDDLNIGAQIKSPAETMVGFTMHLHYNDRYIRNIMSALGLELFNPPNVSGWKGYRTWVSTKTLPTTIYYLGQEVLSNVKNEDIANWALKLPDYDNPKSLTDNIANLFLARNLNSDRLNKFTQVLLGGAPDYEWYEMIRNKEQAGQRIKILLREIIKAPDYYLA